MTNEENQAICLGSISSVRIETIEPNQWAAQTSLGTMKLRDFGRGPLVLDVDFARLLGFKRARDIRQLIRRMTKASDRRAARFAHVHYSLSVRQQKTHGRGTRPFCVQEYWLTRAQALLLASQSKLPRAWEVTEAVVESYDALLLNRNPTIALLEQALAELAGQRVQFSQCLERLSRLERTARSTEKSFQPIGKAEAEKILKRIRHVADLCIPKKRNLRGWFGLRKHFEVLVRQAAGWSQSARLEEQPASGQNAAITRLLEIEGQAKKTDRSTKKKSTRRSISARKED